MVLQDGYKVPFHHLPPVSLEPRELPFCSLGSVHALESTSGGGLQDPPEGSSGLCGPAQSGVLQPAVSGREGDVGLAVHRRSVGS